MLKTAMRTDIRIVHELTYGYWLQGRQLQHEVDIIHRQTDPLLWRYKESLVSWLSYLASQNPNHLQAKVTSIH